MKRRYLKAVVAGVIAATMIAAPAFAKGHWEAGADGVAKVCFQPKGFDDPVGLKQAALAAAEWSNVTTGLQVTFQNCAADANIVPITWAPTGPHTMSPGCDVTPTQDIMGTTCSEWSGSTQEIITAAPIEYSQANMAKFVAQDGPNAWRMVLCHEMGHAIGLDHKLDKDSCMQTEEGGNKIDDSNLPVLPGASDRKTLLQEYGGTAKASTATAPASSGAQDPVAVKPAPAITPTTPTTLTLKPTATPSAGSTTGSIGTTGVGSAGVGTTGAVQPEDPGMVGMDDPVSSTGTGTSTGSTGGGSVSSPPSSGTAIDPSTGLEDPVVDLGSGGQSDPAVDNGMEPGTSTDPIPPKDPTQMDPGAMDPGTAADPMDPGVIETTSAPATDPDEAAPTSSGTGSGTSGMPGTTGTTTGSGGKGGKGGKGGRGGDSGHMGGWSCSGSAGLPDGAQEAIDDALAQAGQSGDEAMAQIKQQMREAWLTHLKSQSKRHHRGHWVWRGGTGATGPDATSANVKHHRGH